MGATGWKGLPGNSTPTCSVAVSPGLCSQRPHSGGASSSFCAPGSEWRGRGGRLSAGLWAEPQGAARPPLHHLCGLSFLRKGEGASWEGAVASAQMTALSIHPYALPSCGAFRLHRFADRADLPRAFRNPPSAETTQPAATSRGAPLPRPPVPSSLPHPLSGPTKNKHVHKYLTGRQK